MPVDKEFVARVDELKAVVADLVSSWVPPEYVSHIAKVSEAVDALAIVVSSAKD